jgi:MSHA biogenesis protein MshK
MAQRMKPPGLCTIVLLASSFAAHGQGLADPTRPPSAPLQSEAAAAGSDPSRPQLHSILLSPSRKLAVINGETVALGGRFGEATLVRISETGVVLKRGEALEALPLLPGIDKKSAAKRRADKGDKR